MPQPFVIEEGVLIRYNQCPGTPQSEIPFPEGVTEIGEGAFRYCAGLTEITIPEGVTTIAKWAFCECTNLKRVTLPSTLKKIGYSAFARCERLTEIIIPDGVTTIDNLVFCNCTELHSVILPSTLESITTGGFTLCKSLTELIIPSSVSEIHYEAFRGCARLAKIIIPSSVSKIGMRAFYECSSDLKIIVEDASKEKYKSMPELADKSIVTFSEKLRDEGFSSEQIIEINRLNYDDKLCFIGCNKEAQNTYVTFSQSRDAGAWVATNGGGESVNINGVQSTDPYNMLLEIMKKYELQDGTPMRNICPLILRDSLEEEGDCLSNYFVRALDDLVAITSVANSNQSFFNGKRKPDTGSDEGRVHKRVRTQI